MISNVSTSYKTILTISIPLILGSLGHNLIAAADTLFLGRYGDTIAFAAIGLVAPFYLMITLVGLSFSRGGQIMIARRLGEKRFDQIGVITRNMLYFILALAALIYVAVKFFSHEILYLFVDDQAILENCATYLYYRIDGIIFGYVGLIAVALYSGVARTNVIIYNTCILASVNIALNYCLIFGNFGFPEMGIAGAGLASTISEVVACFAFILYTIFDKETQKYKIYRRQNIDFKQIKTQLSLSTPIALQSGIAMGSWFIFFSLIENLGTQELAVSSAVRVIYIFLGVSAWGLGSATSTILSNLIGQNKKNEVAPTLHKIAFLSIVITIIPSLILLIAPQATMLVITADSSIIADALPVLQMLFFIEIGIALYTIYFNGLIGVGAIQVSLLITIVSSVIYLFFVDIIIQTTENLVWAWSGELLYSAMIVIACFWYIQSEKWRSLKL